MQELQIPASRDIGYASNLTLYPEQIDTFLQTMEQQGRTAGTLDSYKRALTNFYKALPDDKEITAGAIDDWKENQVKNYFPRTVNVSIAAVNSLLQYLGRRDLQITPVKLSEDTQPELTRAEYLRLLQTARILGKERLYLLVKLFGATGLMVQHLDKVTVQHVERGTIPVSADEQIIIPDFLCQELLDYAERVGISSGPLFVTRDGKPLSRTNVTIGIQSLCGDARVDREKGTPRCLKKLYQTTRENIWADFERMAEQNYQRLLESEQTSVAWEREMAGGL